MKELIFYIIVSALVAPFIEKLRMKATHGKVVNIDHNISAGIGAALFLVDVIVCKLYFWPVILFVPCCIAVRGVFYDPSLNLMLGRYIDEESASTNNNTDRIEKKKKISFWAQRGYYFLAAVIFFFLYEWAKTF